MIRVFPSCKMFGLKLVIAHEILPLVLAFVVADGRATRLPPKPTRPCNLLHLPGRRRPQQAQDHPTEHPGKTLANRAKRVLLRCLQECHVWPGRGQEDANVVESGSEGVSASFGGKAETCKCYRMSGGRCFYNIVAAGKNIVQDIGTPELRDRVDVRTHEHCRIPQETEACLCKVAKCLLQKHRRTLAVSGMKFPPGSCANRACAVSTESS